MATTIQQNESIPASYPSADQDAIWQRIEAYIAHRFTNRSVVWLVEGAGHWTPPLTPATVSTVEGWVEGDGWQTITPPASPWGGYCFDGFGPYRITATVGSGTPPAAILEAVERLAAFYTETADLPAGAMSYSVGIGEIREGYRIDPHATAKALQSSGAADLLRPYRRA